MKHFFVLFALLSIGFYSQVLAQNVAGAVEVGVYSAYQYGYSSGALVINDVNNLRPYPSYENFTYSIPTFGGMIEYHLGSVFSFVGIVRYEKYSQYMSIPSDVTNYRASDSSLHVFDTKFSCEIGGQAVTTSILGKTTFSGTNLSILTGVDVSIVASNSQEIRFYLYPEPGFPTTIDSFPDLVPDNIYGQPHRYLDDSHTAMTVYKGEIDNNSNTLLFGITFGLQYDIPLYAFSESEKKYITLTPIVLWKKALTNLSELNDFSTNVLNLGFALKVGL